uniref:10 kDa chaperonin n=1 Tax=Oryza brachyantha TaxID=4533 RepID=J3LP11_ORYBR
MAKRLLPTLNRVLVEKLLQPNKSAGGILLPETTKQIREVTGCSEVLVVKNGEILVVSLLTSTCGIWELNSAKVVAVGPGERDRDGKLIPVSLKEGDTVLLPEYGGTEVKLAEKDCLLKLASHLAAFDVPNKNV